MKLMGLSFSRPLRTPATVSFQTMRLTIGILGILLPVLLLLWSAGLARPAFLLDSISAYYHTNARDLFVGVLCAVAFFLFCSHGYDLYDLLAFKTAGLAALGVAFFPAFLKSQMNPHIHIAPNVSQASTVVHYVSAGVFFGVLALVCLCLFTKSDQPRLSAGKRAVNRFYRVCGGLILACLVGLALINLLPKDHPLLGLRPVFWLETIALFAFGCSWLVKGWKTQPSSTAAA